MQSVSTALAGHCPRLFATGFKEERSQVWCCREILPQVKKQRQEDGCEMRLGQLGLWNETRSPNKQINEGMKAPSGYRCVLMVVTTGRVNLVL